MNSTPDIIVVGGGVIGTAIAYQLAQESVSVQLLERGPIGREASWAGGGILSAIHPWEYDPALAHLIETGRHRWPEYVPRLTETSGIDLEFQTCGLLMLFRNREQFKKVSSWNDLHSVSQQRLDPTEAGAIEPALGPNFSDSILLPDVAQIRNPRVLQALTQASTRLGVDIQTHTPVQSLLTESGRVTGVRTSRGDISTSQVILAAGAWTGEIELPRNMSPVHVQPVKGQMVLLKSESQTVRHMILRDDRYIIPRKDGRILVGSTVEYESGFCKKPTAETVSRLIVEACELIPDLEKATFLQAWAGLRPYTPHRIPLIGPVPELDGLLVATGHFRNGISMAPITAEIVADLVLGRSPALDLSPFLPGPPNIRASSHSTS
ncbi:MAG: glycine oxidase ThiO, partial [Planctomycetota bacterium]|jgi:glycine oxidase|nr:glycine oxidase ThiO [Planctomycetota bacterium]